MKFNLSTASYFYTEKDMRILEALGFKFEENSGSLKDIEPYVKIDGMAWDENNPTIDISTLEELIEFTKKFGKIVLRDDSSITIYDGYIE